MNMPNINRKAEINTKINANLHIFKTNMSLKTLSVLSKSRAEQAILEELGLNRGKTICLKI